MNQSSNPLDTPKALHLLKAMWLFLGFIFIVDVAWIIAAGLRISIPDLPLPTIAIVCSIPLVSWISATYKPEPHVFLFTQSLLLCLTGTIVLGWLCYLGTWLALPLTDVNLIAIDRSLGLDWHAYVAFITQYPLFEKILRTAYFSEPLENFVILWALALLKRPLDLERLLLAMLIASLTSVILSTLWPAVGTYIFYGINPEDILHYPAAGRIHEHALMGMREHTISALPIQMQGLVTFPSFHTAAAVILMWASRWIKWCFIPIVIFNTLIILSTPIHGGHYFIDVIGGIGVAIASIAAAEAIYRRI